MRERILNILRSLILMVCDLCLSSYFVVYGNDPLFSLFADVSVHTAHSERPASRSPPLETTLPLEAGTLFPNFFQVLRTEPEVIFVLTLQTSPLYFVQVILVRPEGILFRGGLFVMTFV